jgi:hypothetical protein
VARCVQLTTQANVSTYLLDHGILALIDSDNTLPAGRRFRAGRTDQAEPVEAVVIVPDSSLAQYGPDPSFTLIRSDVIEINPTPTEDGMTVQIWAVLRPQPMAGDGDDPSTEPFGGIPYEYHDALITYALWKCADYADDQSSQSGERFRILYEGTDGRGGRLGQIRMLTNKRGSSIPVRRRVRMHRTSSSGSYVG